MTRLHAMRIPAIAAVVLCVSNVGCAHHQPAHAPIREEQIVRAPAAPTAKTAPRILVQPDPPQFAGYWVVPAPVAERANDGLQSFLQTQDPELARQLPEYYGQLLGIEANGKQVVHLNFFCPEEYERIAPYAKMYKGAMSSLDWTRNVIVQRNRFLEDGRKHCFFSVDFDPASHAYVDFWMSDGPFARSKHPVDAGNISEASGDDEPGATPNLPPRPPRLYPDGTAPVVFGNHRRVILRNVDAPRPWLVTLDDARRADAGIEQQLRAQNPGIAAKFFQYRGQFFGFTDRTGKRLVYANFFCPQTDDLVQLEAATSGGDPRMYDDLWMMHLEDGRHVRDGDPDCYFHFTFDPATNSYGAINAGMDASP